MFTHLRWFYPVHAHLRWFYPVHVHPPQMVLPRTCSPTSDGSTPYMFVMCGNEKSSISLFSRTPVSVMTPDPNRPLMVLRTEDGMTDEKARSVTTTERDASRKPDPHLLLSEVTDCTSVLPILSKGAVTLRTSLSNVQGFMPRQPGKTRYWHTGVVGRSHLRRNTHAREDLSCTLLVGRTLCNGGYKLLLLQKAELESTSCNVARNKERCVARCRSTLLHRTTILPVAGKKGTV